MAQTVTHDEVYNQIQDGDIMYVSKSTHIISRIIQFFTKSPYSHIAILFWMTAPGGERRVMVAEAQTFTTLRIQDFDYYRNLPLAITSGPKPFLEYEKAALARIGAIPYGYMEAVYTGLRDFFWVYFGIVIPKATFSGEICSEYVARCLGLNSVDVSPQDVFNEIGLPVKFTVNP